MEDMRILDIKDLEDVAGGATLNEQMTADEKAHLENLKLRLKDATIDYASGNISKAEYDAAKNELLDYTTKMCKKYNCW